MHRRERLVDSKGKAAISSGAMPYILGEGGPEDRRSIPLATRKGTTIPNSRRWEMSPEAVEGSRQQWSALQPDAELRSLSTFSNTYNCMGCVFASRRTWVDTDCLRLIMGDDGYQSVDQKDAMPGDLVLYKDSTRSVVHVGVILEKNPDVRSARFRFKVLSKWGSGGEFIHQMESIPDILGSPSQFITERRLS
jgi:hypothetical protein